MAAIAWLAEGRHTDTPDCACPVIAAFVRAGNDAMPDDERQRLLPYLHRIAGSRSAAHEGGRLRILVLGALRVFAPRALDAAGLHEHAERLRALPDDVDLADAEAAAEAAGREAAEAAEAAARAARGEAWAAWAAAWAAWGAAGAARAARAASWAARAARAAGTWDDYFAVLDAALSAGPQGEPWSADAVAPAVDAFQRAGGVGILA
jgi:hypothetical protein